jgi:hypothetical protein
LPVGFVSCLDFNSLYLELGSIKLLKYVHGIIDNLEFEIIGKVYASKKRAEESHDMVILIKFLPSVMFSMILLTELSEIMENVSKLDTLLSNLLDDFGTVTIR